LISCNALIFDLDGTLIDSSDGVVDAVNYSLRQVNALEQPPDRIKRFIGFPLAQMYPHFTDHPFDELHSHFQVRAAETIIKSTVPLEGVDQAIRLLHSRGMRMGIATTKIRRHLDEIVDKFGWRPMFDSLVGGDEVSDVKPAPEAFILALRRMGARAGDTVVIGDTINDVLAAKAVPMRVIAVRSPYGGLDELAASNPDYLVSSLTEVLPLLGVNGREKQ